jgi:hypothetical protein
MKDTTGLEIYKHAHVGMALTDIELVDPEILETFQRGLYSGSSNDHCGYP